MSELGLFPLPIVLLPTERVPLHIFEDRYKELIGECLAREGEFGLVLADERGCPRPGGCEADRSRALVVVLVAMKDDGDAVPLEQRLERGQ